MTTIIHNTDGSITVSTTIHFEGSMIRRATARLMIDFGTPVTKIDSPRGESIVPQFVLRPLQLRTKAATLKLPH